ncbi:hypothetical protein BX600DRAFT_230118 [Xylariales sp. PMI_506]|nr:hypothetical protein BX600DRAFT_230118 [Xylariales sp. PMI_506]
MLDDVVFPRFCFSDAFIECRFFFVFECLISTCSARAKTRPWRTLELIFQESAIVSQASEGKRRGALGHWRGGARIGSHRTCFRCILWRAWKRKSDRRATRYYWWEVVTWESSYHLSLNFVSPSFAPYSSYICLRTRRFCAQDMRHATTHLITSPDAKRCGVYGRGHLYMFEMVPYRTTQPKGPGVRLPPISCKYL